MTFIESIRRWNSCGGDIHTNPGPNNNVNKRLTFASWNVDGILSRNASKISLIESLQDSNHYDLFGISESYLSDKNLLSDVEIKGFAPTPFRSDSPKANDHAQGGVLLYHREDLPIIERKDLNTLN